WILVIEKIECSGGEAESRRFFIMVGGDGEVVSPAEVHIDVGGHGLRVARDAIGAGVEQAVAVSVRAGSEGVGADGVGEHAGSNVVNALGVHHRVHADTV